MTFSAGTRSAMCRTRAGEDASLFRSPTWNKTGSPGGAHIRVHRRERDEARLGRSRGEQEIVARGHMLGLERGGGDDKPRVQPLCTREEAGDGAVGLHDEIVIVGYVIGRAAGDFIGENVRMHVDELAEFRH